MEFAPSKPNHLSAKWIINQWVSKEAMTNIIYEFLYIKSQIWEPAAGSQKQPLYYWEHFDACKYIKTDLTSSYIWKAKFENLPRVLKNDIVKFENMLNSNMPPAFFELLKHKRVPLALSCVLCGRWDLNPHGENPARFWVWFVCHSDTPA